MNRESIDESREKIRDYHIKKHWMMVYNLSELLLSLLKDNAIANSNDYMFCYVYMSNSMIQMGNISKALSIVEDVYGVIIEDDEKITINSVIANCHYALNNISESVKKHDENIMLCKKWINNMPLKQPIKDKNKIMASMADAIHNKGDCLNDANLIIESIDIYKSLLGKEGINLKIIQRNLDNAYRNLSRIKPVTYIACR